MRRLRTAIVLAALFSSCLCLPVSAENGDSTIIVLLSRKDGVLVSTKRGLFKSKTAEKHWNPVALPADVSPGGCLYSGAPNTAPIYYTAPLKVETINGSCLWAAGVGLWVSEDEGGHWTLVDNGDFFRDVYPGSDGLLYAAMRERSAAQEDVYNRMPIFGGYAAVSADGGRTWKKLGGDNSPSISSIGQCGDNPAHLCASNASDTGPTLREYAPETGRWTITTGFMQVSNEQAHFDVKSFPVEVDSMSVGSGCCFTYRATLDNYFRDFSKDSLGKPGLYIQAVKDHYSFQPKGPKVIEVEMKMLRMDSPESIRIPDISSKQECWSMEYIDPDGTFHFVVSDNRGHPAANRPTVHILTPAQSYRRHIDLNAIAHFTKPGVYKVAMLFDNDGVKNPGPEDWTGELSGQSFEVSISQ